MRLPARRRSRLPKATKSRSTPASLAPVGVFNLTWHNNYTPDGIKTPEFPGAIISNKSLNGVTEWAYGITDWFEGGLYLPLYSRDENLGWKIDGFKLRTLFAVPHADDRTFVYGVNIDTASTRNGGIRSASPPKCGRLSAGTSISSI